MVFGGKYCGIGQKKGEEKESIQNGVRTPWNAGSGYLGENTVVLWAAMGIFGANTVVLGDK